MSDTVKERPILFSGPMVCALLDGSKTQTRRVTGLDRINAAPDDFAFSHWCSGGVACFDALPHAAAKHGCGQVLVRCPYGAAGGRLWVRECWNRILEGLGGFLVPDRTPDPADPRYCAVYHATLPENAHTAKRPSIHMPRWASRITLEIVSIRAGRLQNISEADAMAEGVDPLFSPEKVKERPDCDLDPMPWANYLWHGHRDVTPKQVDSWPHQFSSYDTARGSFSSLWEKINAKRGYGWAVNPWVWAVEFRRLEAV